MNIPIHLPRTLFSLSRANTWRVIATVLFVLLGVLLVVDALIFLRYGIGWGVGVTPQQFTPVVLRGQQLDEATRVVQQREDIRATRNYGALPRNLFK